MLYTPPPIAIYQTANWIMNASFWFRFLWYLTDLTSIQNILQYLFVTKFASTSSLLNSLTIELTHQNNSLLCMWFVAVMSFSFYRMCTMFGGYKCWLNLHLNLHCSMEAQNSSVHKFLADGCLNVSFMKRLLCHHLMCCTFLISCHDGCISQSPEYWAILLHKKSA